jgi:hypothetical protein
VGEIALELEQLNEPFYSAVMTAVMRKAVDFCQIKLEKQP